MKITHREKNRIKKLHESYRGWNGSLIREDEDKVDGPITGGLVNSSLGLPRQGVGNIVKKIFQKKNGEKVIKYFFVGTTPRVPRTDGVIGFLPGDDNVTILLCGVTDDLAHLINDPNGLVSVEWSATVNGQPNGPCTSPVELKMKAHIEPEKEEVDDWWNNEITESRLKKKVLKEQTGELKGLRELGDYLELLIDKRWISLEIAQRIFDLSVIDVDYLLDNIMDWCECED